MESRGDSFRKRDRGHYRRVALFGVMGSAASRYLVHLEAEANKSEAVDDLPDDPAVLKAEIARLREGLRNALVVVETEKKSQGVQDIADRVRGALFEKFHSFKSCFNAIDANGGGTISKEELANALKSAGFEVDDESLGTILERFDVDGSGDLDYAEFVRFLDGNDEFWTQGCDAETRSHLESLAGTLRSQVNAHFYSLREAFLALDVNKSGSISCDELGPLLQNSNLSWLTDDDISLFVASYKHEGSGGFKYHEFCNMISGVSKPFAAESMGDFAPELDPQESPNLTTLADTNLNSGVPADC